MCSRSCRCHAAVSEIARAGHPVAKLIAWEETPNKIAAPGALAKKGYWIADDFDAEIQGLFES